MLHGLNCNQVQTSAFSVSAWKLEMSGLAVAVQVVNHSTVGDCMVQTTFGCHWSLCPVVDGWHRQLAAVVSEVWGRYATSDWWTKLVILKVIRCQTSSQCSCRNDHTIKRQLPGPQPRSALTVRSAVGRRWCHTAVSCSNPCGMRWMPGPASWWHAWARSDHWSELA